ncbi:MAG: hypothetical protein VX982_04390, partial [Chloroflexota bacterium]|nr:hypothetical protein [Chloroflexota bacterium]
SFMVSPPVEGNSFEIKGLTSVWKLDRLSCLITFTPQELRCLRQCSSQSKPLRPNYTAQAN